MSEFREVINGYKYKIVSDFIYDTDLCTVNIEVERYAYKVTNIEEIDRYLSELIICIMKNDIKEKCKGFSTNGCMKHIKDNIYELNWIVDIKISKYNLLKEFCEGRELKLLSGELKNKIGIYVVEEKGLVLKKIIEYVEIDNIRYELKEIEFEFLDIYDQITYEETI
ncbi:hypothetical protein [Clostridium sp. DL1XJH146]